MPRTRAQLLMLGLLAIRWRSSLGQFSNHAKLHIPMLAELRDA